MNTGPSPAVTAVIVTWNSRAHIGAALDALRVVHEAGELECVVVDNCSGDDTVEFIKRAHPWVRIVRSETNLGFGRGCNLGARDATTPYLLFLNPDAELDRANLDVLLRFIQSRPRVGLVGPAILEGEKEAVQKAGLMTTPGTLVRMALGRVREDGWGVPVIPGSAPFRTNWICGAAMLVRTEVFRGAGGFDPRFFLYFEETDLCRRIDASGAEIWAVGGAVARHIGGASAGQSDEPVSRKAISEHFYRSRFYYLVKHFGWIRAVSAEVLVRVLDSVRHVRDRLQGRAPKARAAARRPFLSFPARPGEGP